MLIEKGFKSKNASLAGIGITKGTIHWNLSPDELAVITLKNGQGVKTSTDAVAIDTGEFTGRSPQDRFIVKDESTEDHVWWGDSNKPFEPEKFDRLFDKVIRYLNERDIYVRDAYACADPNYRINIRAVTELPWSNWFVYNMFLRPSEDEIKSQEPEWLIVCAPGFRADPEVDGTRQHNFSILNFKRKIALVGGSGYTGEIKKGIFSALNFVLPHEKDTLSMHCSANIGEDGDTALFFGLSGTGKTTLSADPERKLIGDDEHGWSHENTIFNFEGGCYAKVINLSPEKEPDIYRAIGKGALLENIVFYPNSHQVDYGNGAKTENTRVSYPLYNIRNIARPSVGYDPKNIFFLTCDAFGVLPPLSRLTPGQAAFHFISGYTAKVAGTEEGIEDPVTTFSACFGAPFMLLHPALYAEMLSRKIRESRVKVWLVNTGWSGGPFGVGSRMSLKHTRALITAALNGDLDHVLFETHEIFGLNMPIFCPKVPREVLNPRNTWASKEDYDNKAILLAEAFLENFEKFSAYASEETLAGAPKIKERI